MYAILVRAFSFDQDLSLWCVSKVDSGTGSTEFDYIDDLNNSKKPIWGTCPSQSSIGDISSEEINDSIYEVQFISNNVGFATTGQRLLKTKDGGSSWTQLYESSGISEVLFINESTGYINTDGGFSESRLLKTSDGGLSFQEIYRTTRSISDIYYVNGTLIISSSSYYSKVNEYESNDGESNVGIIMNSMFSISKDGGTTFDSYDFYESNNANCNGGSNICDSHGQFSIALKDNILLWDMGGNTGNWVVRFDLDTNDLDDFVYNDDRQSLLGGMIVKTPPIRIKSYSVTGNKFMLLDITTRKILI